MTTNTGFVITDVGNASATTATPGGPYIHITQFRVTDAVNWEPNGTETLLPGNVLYTGGVTNYYVVDHDTIELILFMDGTVGPFSFGTIGIFLADGTLFASCVYDTLQEKIRAVGNQAGAQWRIRARLKLARASVVCRVDVITTMQVLEVSSWQSLVTPANQVGNANMAIVHERTPHRDSVLVYKTDDNTWAINDFTEVFRGSTDDPGCVIGTDNIQHPNLPGTYFVVPQTNSRYLIKFPDGDIRRLTDVVGDEATFAPAKAVNLAGEFSIWEDAQSACCRSRWADRREYNAIANVFNVYWGAPNGTYPNAHGSSQVPLPVLVNPRQPTLADWTRVHDAMIAKCKIHGVPWADILYTDYAYCESQSASLGWGMKTLADQYEIVYGKLALINTNRNNVDPVYQESTVPANGTATRTDIWTGTKVHNATLTYASATHYKALANSGHRIMISPSVQTGVNTWWNDLKTLMASIGVINIDRGGTASTGAGTGSGVGLLTLNTAPQTLFSHAGPVDGGTVTFVVKASINAAGTVVVVTTEITRTGGGLYAAGSTDLFTNQVAIRKPRSDVLNTPVLEYPALVSTGDFVATNVPPPPAVVNVAHVGTGSKQNTVTGSSLVIPKPAGVTSGDLMIGVMGGKTNLPGGWDATAGWAQNALLGDGPMMRVVTRTVDGSEGTDFTFTSTVSRLLGGCIFAFRNAVLDQMGTFGHATAGGVLAIPSITPSNGSKIILAVMDQGELVTVPNITGWTELTGAVNSDAYGPSWRIFMRDVPGAGVPTSVFNVDTSATSGDSAAILFSIKTP